jgi:hypothetical protein
VIAVILLDLAMGQQKAVIVAVAESELQAGVEVAAVNAAAAVVIAAAMAAVHAAVALEKTKVVDLGGLTIMAWIP